MEEVWQEGAARHEQDVRQHDPNTSKRLTLRHGLLKNIVLFYLWFVSIPIIYGFLPEKGVIVIMYAHNVILAFIFIAIANALLGTIAAGFTISASIHAFVIGDGLPDVFIWKDIFEFFEISSAPMTILLLVSMALASASEAISSFFERINPIG